MVIMNPVLSNHAREIAELCAKYQLLRSAVERQLVWDVVQTKIPALSKQLDAACSQAGS